MAQLTGGGWWRYDAIVREAAANLWARRTRFAALGLVVAAVVGLLLWADLSAARSAIAAKREFLAAGGTVVLVSRDDGPLDAVECATASHLPYVIAAGGTRNGGTERFDHAPGTPFKTVYTSGDVLRVLDPAAGRTTGMGLVLPAAAAAELGATTGSHLSLRGAVWTVDSVVETEPRAPQLSRSILLSEPPTGEIDQCWVEFADGAHDDGVKTLFAWFAAEDLTVTPLVDRNIATRDFAADWAGRAQRTGWIAAGALIAAFALLLTWPRRAEFALYVVLGTARSVVALLQTIELWVVITCGGLLGCLWGSAITAFAGHPGGPALRHGLRAATLTVTLALALVSLLSTWLIRADLAARLKDQPG